MPTYRYPVLMVTDAAGGFTALPVDCLEGLAGFGGTPREALGQCREFLVWRFRQTGGLVEADFKDVQLSIFKTTVRPEYRVGDRIDPCPEGVLLRVPCIHGRQQSGTLVAALPLVGVRFTYYEEPALRSLVSRYTQQRLEGLTPRELTRFLIPADVSLTELVVHLPRPANPQGESTDPPALAAVAEPLGVRALRRQFAHAWERDDEVANLVRKLKHEPAHLLLVGEPGVGKSTVLAEAVRAIERTDEGKPRAVRSRFWLTSAGRLIAGMKYLGQWEDRCEKVIAELAQVDGVLCVDRLLDLVGTGGVGPTDSLAAFFVPYLQRNELRLIGEATPAELDACRRLLPGFADLFQPVPLAAFTRAQALAVLDRVAGQFRLNLKLEIEAEATGRVYHLHRRFAPYESFPGKAVTFFKNLSEARARDPLTPSPSPAAGRGEEDCSPLPAAGEGLGVRGKTVTAADVVARFSEQTGLPERFLRDELSLVRDDVLAGLRSAVIGQEEACRAAANLVTTFKAGLNDPHRPLGVLLFCGPTGVGKTEMARTLARVFFGQCDPAHLDPSDARGADRLVRLDMSEYSGFDAVDRLLGPPHGEPSSLVRQLRQQPFCVLLLDEIEKAGPEVFDVLLGVFDEGRLTDRYGRTTTFRSAVIVLTSNLGADRATAFGFQSGPAVRYCDEARRFFRPEFFNRLDAVVTFQPLPPEVIRAIARKELTAVTRREGLERHGLSLRPTERLVEHLAATGFDARYGARPLQRTVEKLVVTPLARFLLGRPGLRDAVIEADLQDGPEATFRL